ncbi:MAG: hypothetical protein WCA55_14390, partial [Xanthobacteraceae bacterium]
MDTVDLQTLDYPGHSRACGVERGHAMAARERNDPVELAIEHRIAGDNKRAYVLGDEVANTLSRSPSLLALRIWIGWPIARAAVCTSLSS